MGKFYRANQELKDFLTTLGLSFHDREEAGIAYFTQHETGKQVLVNSNKNLITFFDAYGIVVDESSSYTNNQVEAFLN